ncbi:uncharacterized protein LOC111347585 [Stylophora pistillata]|uniref:uncharacterized protein LOC111347585 n=1 Tax=Stylophora pistillata TaxID=50429 RepID=UPI000C049280|nr:uncharacterized protein LOC111347585 [Stylophora pistillata]
MEAGWRRPAVSFCMKTSTLNDFNRNQWPSGKYCIYLRGKTCPSGMRDGWVQWNDENTIIIYNKNTRRGTLPTGIYDQDTLISYCCSVLGSTQTPIDFPLTSPFYLIAFGSRVCQLVRRAKASLEYIYYETEYSKFVMKNDYGGAHPHGVTRDPQGHMIFDCYYRRKLQVIL